MRLESNDNVEMLSPFHEEKGAIYVEIQFNRSK